MSCRIFFAKGLCPVSILPRSWSTARAGSSSTASLKWEIFQRIRPSAEPSYYNLQEELPENPLYINNCCCAFKGQFLSTKAFRFSILSIVHCFLASEFQLASIHCLTFAGSHCYAADLPPLRILKSWNSELVLRSPWCLGRNPSSQSDKLWDFQHEAIDDVCQDRVQNRNCVRYLGCQPVERWTPALHNKPQTVSRVSEVSEHMSVHMPD